MILLGSTRKKIHASNYIPRHQGMIIVALTILNHFHCHQHREPSFSSIGKTIQSKRETW